MLAPSRAARAVALLTEPPATPGWDVGATVQRHQAPQMPCRRTTPDRGPGEGQTAGEASICACLRPGMYICHGPGALDGFGDEVGEFAPGLQPRPPPGSRGRAGCRARPCRHRGALSPPGSAPPGTRQELAPRWQRRAQVVIGLVLPPASLVGEQAVQLSKTVASKVNLSFGAKGRLILQRSAVKSTRPWSPVASTKAGICAIFRSPHSRSPPRRAALPL